MPHPLDAYFGAAPTADQLVPVDAYTRGAVTRTETLWREAPVAGGFFDPAIFGPLDGSSPTWGHIDIAAGISIAGTRVTRIPVPPIAQRLPRVVDDPLARTLWHQRINEAWLALLHASRMHDRFVSLGGPSQAAHVQQHFEDIVAVMRGEEPASHHGDHAPGDHAPGDHAHGDRRHVSRDDVYTMMPCPPSEPARPLALLFLDDGRLLVQSTIGCRVMTRAIGASLAPDIAWVASDLAWTPTGPRASSVHGELVVFNGGQRDVWRRGSYPEGLAWPEDALRSAPLAAYDLRARAWVMLVDERFPAWVVDETDVAGADAHELATGQTHDLVAGSQRAAQLAQTRDGRFVLARVARLAMFDDATDAADEDDADEDDADEDDADVFGVPSDDDARDYVLSIIEIATQRPFVIATDAPAILPVVVLGAPTTTRPAVCASNDGWRIVDPSGAVGDGERWWYRLEGASLVAWSPRGDQLAAIVGDEIVILDLAPTGATIASRAPLGGASS